MSGQRLILGTMLGTFFFLSASLAATPLSFEKEIRSALSFLEYHQVDLADGYDPGQWRARVTSYVPSPIGVGKFGVPYEEPTAFVSASVANVLAEIYTLNPRYENILAMLDRTREGLNLYRWGALFNFYPPAVSKGVKIRAPRYMYLARQWKGFANIPPDADTTSVTHTFLQHLEHLNSATAPLPPQVLKAFATARDVHRTPHTYNALQGHVNTGAYLTWLYDENNQAMPRNIFAAPHRGTRIPFNKNDVDCVVNGNVLKLLTLAGNTSNSGYQASCSHLNRVVRLKQFYFCGMYYPSYYALPYTIATALEAGASCLQPSQERVLNYILSKQNKDGSWRNSFLARPDYIQSTAWALNTLLLLGNPENELHRQRVRRGVRFLLSQARRDNEGRLFWSGQVFFAATFIARYPVVWRSTAYTTALATKALLLAERFN